MSSLAYSWKESSGSREGLRIGWDDRDEDSLSTGSIALDMATGLGGLPMGKVTEIYGAEASGKTSLALAAVARAQQAGVSTAWLESENKLTRAVVRRSNVDLNKILLIRCADAVLALRTLLDLIHSGNFGLIVLDSVAGLLPFSDIHGNASHSGEIERLLENALPLIASEASKRYSSLLLLNQIRIDDGKVFGDCIITPGGKVLRHTCSLRIELTKKTAIKGGSDSVLGSLHRATIKKNSLAAGWQMADLVFTHARGLDQLYEAVVHGQRWGLFTGGKAHLEFRGIRLGITELEAYDRLVQDRELAETLLRAAASLLQRRVYQEVR